MIFLKYKRDLSSRRGAVLIVSLLILVFLTILLGAAMLRSNMQIREVVNRRQVQEAFYAAEAGVNRAVFELRQNPVWRVLEPDLLDYTNIPLTVTVAGSEVTIGSYSILEVKDNTARFQGWDTVWVTVRGRDADNDLSRTIKALVIVDNPTRFLISTLGLLQITSGSTLNADVLANTINFAVNDSLPAPANEIHMGGEVLYITSVANANNPAVFFSPDHPAPVRTSSITFPGVVLDKYLGIANDLLPQNLSYVHSSTSRLDVDLSNLDSLGPGGEPFQPRIIYAAGDVYLSGEYDHSLTVVAGGNIYITGSVEPTGAGSPTRPQIGLFAKRDVLIPQNVVTNEGNINIEAFVLADGGAFIAQGPKFSQGTLNFNGAIFVRGRGTTGVDLNVFRNRVYNYNPNLNTNRSIPFLPFIVNIVQWQEL